MKSILVFLILFFHDSCKFEIFQNKILEKYRDSRDEQNDTEVTLEI